ncbi:MAG: VWA domain-containing protein [Ruminococcaceae bacterium]|nr:VWA domain-containing protein [Oscillospiraceae bacterium]
MFCPNCGAQNNENTRFCGKCGKELNPSAKTDAFVPYSKRNPQPEPVKPVKRPKPQKPKKPYDGKLKIAAPVICLLVCIGIISGAGFGLVAEAKKHEPTPISSDFKNDPTPANLKYDKDKIVNTTLANSFNEEPGSDADVKALDKETAAVQKLITAAEAELKKDYKEINESNLDDYLYDLYYDNYDNFSKSKVISDFEYSDSCLTFELASGAVYVYAPTVDGCDAGEGGVRANAPVADFEFQISTYQPCLSGYDSGLENYMRYPDTGAIIIDNAFDTYVFNDDFNHDDDEVNVSGLYDFQKSNVILWHGHGCCSDSYGSLMVIGIPRTTKNDKTYHSLIEKGIFILGNDCYFVGADFFDIALSDGSMDNSVVYLGSCSSGEDERLANVLLEKGAAAVYANSGTIHTTYNLSMLLSVAEGLAKTDSDGLFYTVEAALEFAKDENGDHDTGDLRNTEVLLYTNNNAFSLDWYQNHIISDRSIVMVLDNSGSMEGKPLDETIDASASFVETVTQYNAQVGIVTFDDNAERICDFTVRKSVLDRKINNMSAGSTTNIHAGLEEAKRMLDETDSSKKIIVLMSDGLPNDGYCGSDLISYAQDLKSEGIIVYALGFFHSMNPSEKTEPQQLLEGIATEGCHFEIENADDVVFFFDDVASQISGQKYVYIKIACPVDVIIKHGKEELSTKGKKNRASFGSISYENATGATNQPNSDKDDLAKVIRLLDGVNYEVEILANDDGEMDYTISYMDENGDYTDTREFTAIDLTDNTIIKTQTGKSEKTLLSIDEDGDGSVDIEYEAEENSEGKEVDRSMEQIYWIAIACASFIIVICVLVIIFKARKHKKWKASHLKQQNSDLALK